MEDLFDEVEGSEQDVIRHLIADIRFDADTLDEILGKNNG